MEKKAGRHLRTPAQGPKGPENEKSVEQNFQALGRESLRLEQKAKGHPGPAGKVKDPAPAIHASHGRPVPVKSL